MLQRTPGRNRDHDPAPWWSWFVDSSLGRGVVMTAVLIVAAICVYSILTTKSHITTGGPNPGFLR